MSILLFTTSVSEARCLFICFVTGVLCSVRIDSIFVLKAFRAFILCNVSFFVVYVSIRRILYLSVFLSVGFFVWFLGVN